MEQLAVADESNSAQVYDNQAFSGVRELPERDDDPPFIHTLRLLTHASPEVLQAFIAEFSPPA